MVAKLLLFFLVCVGGLSTWLEFGVGEDCLPIWDQITVPKNIDVSSWPEMMFPKSDETDKELHILRAYAVLRALEDTSLLPPLGRSCQETSMGHPQWACDCAYEMWQLHGIILGK
eukprot:TRINITY_DN13892_c0_g1_i1.p1 TRINITY_DN13892_c0_g1~~TRINITY_DN13892_c0_g1_i1.p1  ORF type:complete len:115 (-),score=8.70 TRINITY_DN13892_c0_g1_i1:45-389(-)